MAWTADWAVTQSFPLLAGLGLGVAYALYAAFSAVALAFVWRLLPETRGRALGRGADTASWGPPRPGDPHRLPITRPARAPAAPAAAGR